MTLHSDATDPSSASGPEDRGRDDEPACSTAPRVELACETDRPPDTDRLRRTLGGVCRLLGLRRVDLNVIIVCDERMAELHRRYLGLEGPTDVLSFDLREEAGAAFRGPAEEPIDGEVYICLDEARRRARSSGVAVEHELLLYAVHGLLHLWGYDDRTPADARRMHEREDELLTAVGVGPVFGRGSDDRGGSG